MKTVEELNKKVAEEITSFARLHSVAPDQVTGFWDAVQIHMSLDHSDKSEVVKKARAVRHIARTYPYLHFKLRQQLLAEAMLSDSEKREHAAKTAEEKEDYVKFMYMPLEGDSDGQT
jgi:hypothetical protein